MEKLSKIYNAVTKVYGVTLSDKTRKRHNVEARQAFCFFARTRTKEKMVTIGTAIGINYATVNYGATHYYELLHYPDIKGRYERILGYLE